MKPASPILLCRAPDQLLPSDIAVLSHEEQARFARFKVGRAAREFATGRLLVRTVLAEVAAASPADIVISIDANGKPSTPFLNVSFSLSHTVGHVALMVSESPGPLGVDIEEFDDPTLIDEVGPEILTAKEQDYVASADDRLAIFGRLWTAKEAALKFCGTGFLTPPQSVEVEFSGARGVAHIAQGPYPQIPLWHGRLPDSKMHIAVASSSLGPDAAAPGIQPVAIRPAPGAAIEIVPAGPTMPFPPSIGD